MLGAGRLEEVVEETTRLATITVTAGDEFDLMEVRAIQAIALCEQGRATESTPFIDWLVAAARRSDALDILVEGLSAAAITKAAIAESSAAAALLGEIEDVLVSAESRELAAYLPAVVRVGPVIGDIEAVARLIDHVGAADPYAQHAALASAAVVAEARGETRPRRPKAISKRCRDGRRSASSWKKATPCWVPVAA